MKSYEDRTVLDRNGVPKTVRVEITEADTKPSLMINIPSNLRGLEFGWGENDSAPDDGGWSAGRQYAQEHVEDSGGRVIARHLPNYNIDLVYVMGNDIVFCLVNRVSEMMHGDWMKDSGIDGANYNIFEQEIMVSESGDVRSARPVALSDDLDTL